MEANNEILSPKELEEKMHSLHNDNTLTVRDDSGLIMEVSAKKGITFPPGKTSAVISVKESGLIGFINNLPLTTFFLLSEYNKLHKSYVELQNKLNVNDE
ncbi:MAG TPA: hypothetical protein VK151_08740 [Fluviicola sp.]|nr:hypothetical protein [Fluviicola sp.]